MKRLFPTLAAWPPAKWMVLPAVAFIFFALVAGTAAFIFESVGWYGR